MSDRIGGYADAILAVARAEDDVEVLSDELFEIGRLLETNDELRDALTDARIPVERRMQIVEDIFDGRARNATKGLVSMLVAAGRAGDLNRIAVAVAERAASDNSKKLATVRTAIALSDEQRERLAEALSDKVGTAIDIKIVQDPSIVGGVVTTIGDTVIDGSVRTRLSRLREAL